MIEVNESITIPDEELRTTFVRSGGPGGQNVNKVATKAVIRWHVTVTPSLPEGVRQRFLERFRTRLTQDGELVVTSQRYRSQERNQQDAEAKIREMIVAVLTPPKRRRPTRPTKGSVARRLDQKKQKSERKRERRSPRRED